MTFYKNRKTFYSKLKSDAWYVHLQYLTSKNEFFILVGFEAV